jgi:hypothetical protein
VLTEELCAHPWGKLRVFHAQCVRGMCRVALIKAPGTVRGHCTTQAAAAAAAAATAAAAAATTSASARAGAAASGTASAAAAAAAAGRSRSQEHSRAEAEGQSARRECVTTRWARNIQTRASP